MNEERAFDRTLRRIHRRWIIIRIFERAGVSVVIAGIVALILSSILLYRGESALLLTCVCLSLGLLCGLAVGWISRPTVFDTATEVDRQLHLADLLGTALSIRQARTIVADDLDAQWSETILSLAETRCATVAGEPLMLHRFGVRAWAGIGICTAIALTLGVLSMNPLVLEARNVPDNRHAEVVTGQPASAPRSTRQSAIDPQLQREPESPRRSQFESPEANRSESTSSSNSTTSDSAADQTGSGTGRTDSLAKTADLTGASDSSSKNVGDSATGGGKTSDHSTSGAASQGSATDGSLSSPPWRASDWPSAQQRADQQLHRGDIPDPYRDLVRDYFNH